MKNPVTLALLLVLLAGCAGDVLDDIEDREWDAAAAKVSAWCAGEGDLWWQRTRIEARREIRQRGYAGPPPPAAPVAGLDERTATGGGPVLMIWCVGETNGQGETYPVPDQVWRGMIRDWRD